MGHNAGVSNLRRDVCTSIPSWLAPVNACPRGPLQRRLSSVGKVKMSLTCRSGLGAGASNPKARQRRSVINTSEGQARARTRPVYIDPRGLSPPRRVKPPPTDYRAIVSPLLSGRSLLRVRVLPAALITNRLHIGIAGANSGRRTRPLRTVDRWKDFNEASPPIWTGPVV